MEFAKRYFVRRRNLWSSEFKNPKALYESGCESVMSLAYVCGSEVLRPNYTRKNRRLAILFADFILYLVLSFWCTTVFWGRLNDVIFCFVTIGGAIQAFAKISSYTGKGLYDLHLRNLENFKNDRNYDEVQEIMMNVATICKLSVTVFKIIFSGMVGLVMFYSIGGSIMGEHYVLPFGYYFPFIDPDTLVGFVVNFSYQLTFIIYAYCGLQASDLVFLYLIMHAIGATETIIIYLRKLNHLISSNGASSCLDLLHDIIEKHIKLTEYSKDMNDLLKMGIFINFGSLVAQTVFSCFVLATAEEIWYTGLAIVVLSTVQLFTACLLGTLLSSKIYKQIYSFVAMLLNFN
ncbi:uncharacterized protein LOC6045708 isoform X3 [Culex quinquefasciatus]|uniref:uncharacterized protein LOC6045708 isoform X3 n=1 Tax=Culex quinquefasciatus TaxID=7176 RepID=UPI0018E3297E|nr:uncharacterized protein LOC6045708 isoform X3 [Culex quinquefasciatus]